MTAEHAVWNTPLTPLAFLDRSAQVFGDRTAIAYGERRHTYAEFAAEVTRVAHALRGSGVSRGDRVMIYLPMIPEAAAAMLACARIGAVHSVVFGGFSPESLAGRIEDCGAVAVITTGTTLSACAGTLMKAGAAGVFGVCAAATEFNSK